MVVRVLWSEFSVLSSPVRNPPGPLEIAKLVFRVSQRLLARWPSAREHQGAVVEELDLHIRGIGAFAEACVEPSVVLSKPPHPDPVGHCRPDDATAAVV